MFFCIQFRPKRVSWTSESFTKASTSFASKDTLVPWDYNDEPKKSATYFDSEAATRSTSLSSRKYLCS